MNRRAVFGIILTLLLTGVLTSVYSIQQVEALPLPRLYLNPDVSVAEPGESFAVDINIADVEDLFSYEVKVGFDSILEVTLIEEGPFIKEQTTSPLGTDLTSIIDRKNVCVACVTLGPYPGVSGSGTLFTITFTVKAAGESTLDLYDTILMVYPPAPPHPISHDTSDGSFYTTTPAASFSFTPKTIGRPIVGEIVTFDASSSYDPDGGFIVSYAWDFDDDGATGTGVIVNHTFTEPSPISDPYNVTLTVTDNDGKTDTFFFKTITEMVHVKFHDIAVAKIEAPAEINAHEIARIDVTVVSNGSHDDLFNVTAYVNSDPLQTKTLWGPPAEFQEPTTLSFYWNTFINQTIKSPTKLVFGTWTDPLYANASDNFYAYTSTNNSIQRYTGYDFETAGWAGVSKVEIGLEARTEAGGDDQILIQIKPGTTWSEPYTFNITSETDSFFWVDVTNSFSWTAAIMNRTQVHIEYRQIGDTATPIYVDWLPVRITPANPFEAKPGVYAVWANVYLVDVFPPALRPGEEANLDDNTLFGEPITVTQVPKHDIEELKTEIEELGSDGTIDNHGVVGSLIGKLKVAQRLIDKGKIEEAKSVLEDDFIPQVQNLTGIHIRVEAADLLVESAEYIIFHL